MKVFIGFGYNPTDTWIIDLVLPLVKAFGCEVLTGEEIQGERLSTGVIAKIDECDALIGFLTKRSGPDEQGKYFTHQWVVEEIAVALAKDKPIFPIREKGVDPQSGITGDRQRFEYDDKATVLVEVAKFISATKSKFAYKTFMLLPLEFSEVMRSNYKFAKCSYRFLHNGQEYKPEETKLIRFQGGFGVLIKQIPSDMCQVQVNVDYNGGSWSSEFVSVGLMNVQLQKD